MIVMLKVECCKVDGVKHKDQRTKSKETWSTNL